MQHNNGLTWALGILLVVLLVGAAYFVGKKEAMAPAPETANETQEEAPTGKMMAPKWTFVVTGEEEWGAPLTEVTVTFAGKTRVLGTESGSCMVVEESAWPLLDGEISGAICYFGGAGTEFGIFREGDGYVLKKGWVEEAAVEGNMEPRGGFETVFAF